MYTQDLSCYHCGVSGSTIALEAVVVTVTLQFLGPNSAGARVNYSGINITYNIGVTKYSTPTTYVVSYCLWSTMC